LVPKIASRPPAIIAWTSSGIGAEGRRHLGRLQDAEAAARAGADEDDAPPLRSAAAIISTPTAMRSRSRCTGGQHLAILVEHQIDEIVGRELVDAEARGIDRLGGSDCHFERGTIRLQF
jgi:hypothetical protein